MKELITLKNVKKIYTTGEKKYCALGGVNLSINKGELVCNPLKPPWWYGHRNKWNYQSRK